MIVTTENLSSAMMVRFAKIQLLHLVSVSFLTEGINVKMTFLIFLILTERSVHEERWYKFHHQAK